MKASAFTFFLVILAATGLKVNAQTLPGNSTASGTLSLTIAQLLDLSVTSSSNVDFNFSTVSNLDQGIQKTGAVTLTFRSNKKWFVEIQSSSTNFSVVSGSSNKPMPASVLQYRLGGTTTYSSLSTTAAAIAGAQGSEEPRGAGTIGIDYKMNPGYVYKPAGYSLNIVYTISNL